MNVFSIYNKNIEKELNYGRTTEHTFRPAFKSLIESLDSNLHATNEPTREKCGAPDYIIQKGAIPIGYIETKDIDKSLDQVEKTDQFIRYVEGLENFILTNYMEFRWYVNGEHRSTAVLGNVRANGKIGYSKNGESTVMDLLNNFLNYKGTSISTSEELAQRMASIAKIINDIMINIFTLDHQNRSNLYNQYLALKDTLLHNMSQLEFADMYSQTVVYGLFSARVNAGNSSIFTRESAAYAIPKTNPFLRELFNQIAGPFLDESLIWVVDDLVDLLSRTDIGKVVKDFGIKTGKDDPVIHFYETFLKYYKPEERVLRGVYYTPEPVVSYIVDSIDQILINSFSLKRGLADTSKTTRFFTETGENHLVHKVQILDPATGTGTFLHKVIDRVYSSFSNNKGMWSGYVREHLLPRLYGFELLMAPYTVAHMKLGLKLAETGYQFDSDRRLRIFLTNTLERADDEAAYPLFSLNTQFISGEAAAANEIKKIEPIMVILGNPPYSGHSSNNSTWINKLIRGFDDINNEETESYFHIDGKSIGERNPKWLNDDYVKFIRFSQWRIEQTGHGVVAFITPHGYLDNPTFKGMRKSLMNTFDDIYILDLHGNSNKDEGKFENDKNVFDIRTGVAIGIFVKRDRERKTTKVYHQEIWGERKVKYDWLEKNNSETTDWTSIEPKEPMYLFVPRNDDTLSEYHKGWKITDIFPRNSIGIVTARDKFTIHKTEESVFDTVNEFINLGTEEARDKYKLGKDVQDWTVESAQEDIVVTEASKLKIKPISYRPFDTRYTYYTGKSRGFLCRPRRNVMDHMVEEDNIGLVTTRMTKGESFNHIFVSEYISDNCLLSSKTSNRGYMFPLYLYEGNRKTPNISNEFIQFIDKRMKTNFVKHGMGSKDGEIGPEAIFYYTYAILHASEYRIRYEEYLKLDFPYITFTSRKILFMKLSTLGRKLAFTHLNKRNLEIETSYPEEGSNLVEKVKYNKKDNRLYINDRQYFDKVSPEIWEFQIGSYHVLKKWLNERIGDTFEYNDLVYFQQIISILKEATKICAEIDQTINNYGGFPIR
ncbi:type ISP restriction/modification enzyme [Peribacillus simplex]|uniref:site-specific DNA-methyltransferase (adenine-specific) n=1 Tax=Peribacillus simplex TaxID=1478 RepID=A0AAN2TPQ5_9BACI|nr:type ISP restriction/modification enzyme [Peribacillus simplex]CEG24555.1 N-6 DNA Methylase [Peribacillus simplex]